MPMLSRTLTGLLLCCLSTTFSYAEKPKESTNPLTAEEIVTKADSIRFPPEGFQVDVRITTQRPDGVGSAVTVSTDDIGKARWIREYTVDDLHVRRHMQPVEQGNTKTGPHG